MSDVLAVLEVPEIMAGGMTLAEHDQEEIPILLAHQPLRDFGLLRDRGHQPVAKAFVIGRRRHADLAVILRRIRPETRGDLLAQPLGQDGLRAEPGPAAPVDDLRAAEALQRAGEKGIHHHAALAVLIEELPHERHGAQIRPRAHRRLQALLHHVGVIEPVLVGRSAGEDRRPRGDVQHVGRGLQLRPGALRLHPRDVRQQPFALPALDQLAIAGVQPDHQDARSLPAGGAGHGRRACGNASSMETLRPSRAERIAASSMASVHKLSSPLVSATPRPRSASQNWLRMVVMPASG